MGRPNASWEVFEGNCSITVVVLREDPLRRLLHEYVKYYNGERVHTSIGDSPEGRAVQERPSDQAKVIGFPRVGGLHHRYVWAKAA